SRRRDTYRSIHPPPAIPPIPSITNAAAEPHPLPPSRGRPWPPLLFLLPASSSPSLPLRRTPRQVPRHQGLLLLSGFLLRLADGGLCQEDARRQPRRHLLQVLVLVVQPHVIELDQLGAQGPQLQKVLERLTGQSTVPNVFIGGKHIGGCTDTVKLHRKGELATMLSELDIDVNNS
ncbi:Os08g0565800, partial [Oryza sativa Japonica Group]